MRYMTSVEIRETWLNYFKNKGHLIEPSSSLIPVNDPTLLWINAGIAPLKKYFDGSMKPSNPRIANIQKCIRTNDIENVGLTARHHTFFEMLGNFSIGNYFKKEAIDFGFEILTSNKYFGFPIDKLYFTYFPDDLETKELWLKKGVLPSHIIPVLGNYWEIGEGPSGPNTEIFFDRGESFDKRGPNLIKEDIENDRYVEIWNIVFSQFNAKAGLKRSEYPELPNKNIDTGAGLERFACILQGVETNFETDLFLPIINEVEKLTNTEYNGQKEFKIIADHIRTLTLAISDGAMLSNEGRGYVLRRLLRRALKHGKQLGMNEPFLYKLVDVVVTIMKPFYSNVYKRVKIIKQIILKEEAKFLETLIEGEKLLDSLIKEQNLKIIDGNNAFKLYDTYGFPIELTVEVASEHNVLVDIDGFNEALEVQKNRSRAARKNIGSMNVQNEEFINYKQVSRFVGYDTFKCEAKVIKVFNSGVILDYTPFYATSGGQVADTGKINDYEVIDVVKLPNGQNLHVLNGHDLNENDLVLAEIDLEYRDQTVKNHTATHLLHQALKDVFGEHVLQQGSLVNSKYLRFDFNHFENISSEDVLKIERIVKTKIIENLNVEISQMTIEEAKLLGAMALFGEKYGNIVRVVDIAGYSIELCGGTHVKNTLEIVDFAISNIESIGSGIYRVEAVTGRDVVDKIKSKHENIFKEIKQSRSKIESSNYKKKILKKGLLGSYQDVINAFDCLGELRDILKQIDKEAKENLAKNVLSSLDIYIKSDSPKQIIKTFLPHQVLKEAIDQIYDKISAQVIFLVNEFDNKITFLCKTDGVQNASELIKFVAKETNGSGGGKSVLAQGGTNNKELIDSAIEKLSGLL